MPESDHQGGPTSTGELGDDFAREIDLIRSLAADPVEMTDAPPELWARIAAAAEVDGGAPLQLADPPDAELPDREPPDPEPIIAVPSGTEPIVLESRRRRWSTVLVSAAAIVALVVGIGVLAASRTDPAPTELAAAELLPFDGAQVGNAGGQVELIDDGDQLSLRVDMRDLPTPAPGTFYELWLIDPATGEPVSIATMKDGSSDVATDVALPAGTDTDRYEVVDVSVQEDGAGPAHSGNSVLRGTLA